MIGKLLACALLLGASTALAMPATQVRELKPFDSLAVGSGVHVVVMPGDKLGVVVEGEEALLGSVLTEVTKDGLTIRWDGPPSTDRVATVFVTAPQLRRIAASGNAQVDVGRFTGDIGTLIASGASKVTIQAVSFRTLDVRVSGNANVTLARGLVDAAIVEAGGLARLHAREVLVHAANVAGSGSAQLELTVDQKLDTGLSDGAILRVRGNPLGAQARTSRAILQFEPDGPASQLK